MACGGKEDWAFSTVMSCPKGSPIIAIITPRVSNMNFLGVIVMKWVSGGLCSIKKKITPGYRDISISDTLGELP